MTDLLDLERRVALVTGAVEGVGCAIARVLADLADHGAGAVSLAHGAAAA